MSTSSPDRVHALLFGLKDDLAGELLKPLSQFCSRVESLNSAEALGQIETSPAQVIFCGANAALVNHLRSAKPQTAIIVVSRHAEISDWLDAIEAGATDYCAAPFETAQMKWLLDSSTRQHQPAAA